MTRALLLLALLAGCEGDSTPPAQKGCVEFDHVTTHKGAAVTCRMLWCERETMSTDISWHRTGGVATLWCDPVQP